MADRGHRLGGGDKPCSQAGVLAAEYLTILEDCLADDERQDLENISRLYEPPKTLQDPQSHAVYEILHRYEQRRRDEGTSPELAALCLSGGGIRSAAFALGILQGLAQGKQLHRFHYLSTVSGGGYIGAWLSTWIQRKANGLAGVIEALRSTADGGEAVPLQHLRQYTNYLTPQLGIFSADTWAGIVLCLRNLLLNWLILLPLWFALIVLPRPILLFTEIDVIEGRATLCYGVGASLIGLASLLSLLNRPSRKCLAWGARGVGAIIALMLVGAFLVGVAVSILPPAPTASAEIWGGIFAVSWVFAFLVQKSRKGTRRIEARRELLDAFGWTTSGALFGALLGITTDAYDDWLWGHDAAWAQAWWLVLATPTILLFRSLAEMIYLGIVSSLHRWDDDREWFARFSGILLLLAAAWLVLAAIGLFGGTLVTWLADLANGWLVKAIAAAGGVSGFIAAYLGKSAKTVAAAFEKGARAKAALPYNVTMAIAALVFATVLSFAFAWAGDRLAPDGSSLRWYLPGLLFFASVIAALFINVDRFSLHGVYRNRLIRGFLGPTQPDPEHHPNAFTRFDDADNMYMWQLWSENNKPPEEQAEKQGGRRFFHIVNMTLNLAKADNPAWAERKGEPFSASPLHIGAFRLGYRPADEYGNPKLRDEKRGISLGTVMAISGAAVSPNMGYHSSPPMALLMTMFNVRLGCWRGNPKESGWRQDGPNFALGPLLSEALSQTNDESRMVYLSDGGHFDNLGLYEMIRRRCSLIIVSDAGCDPHCQFDDLGNAIRKIKIDLGVDIAFEPGHPAMRARRKPGETAPDQRGSGSDSDTHAALYCAKGTIIYPEPGAQPGRIFYVKPAYHGIEPPDVRSYAETHASFPHEGTGDQWFSESQFESYRRLGAHIAKAYLLPQLKAPAEAPPTMDLVYVVL